MGETLKEDNRDNKNWAFNRHVFIVMWLKLNWIYALLSCNLTIIWEETWLEIRTTQTQPRFFYFQSSELFSYDENTSVICDVIFSIIPPKYMFHVVLILWFLTHTQTHSTSSQRPIHFRTVSFRRSVTGHVRNWHDSGGLEHTLKPKTTINPEFSFGNGF